MIIVICDYCLGPTELVTGQVIYPHRPDLRHLQFYQCASCDAYVGVHQKSSNPLGKLANASLRKARIQAHSAFDPVWREGRLSRTEAYAWLADQLGIDVTDCHIGQFNETQCEQVCAVMSEYYTKSLLRGT